MSGALPAEWVPDPIEGIVLGGPDVERACQGTVEALTEWDWVDVPPELQSALREWWLEFHRWATRQPPR